MEQSLDVIVDHLRVAFDGPDSRLPGGKEALPRYELFHAANSICSQKVRTVLAHLGAPHLAHEMNIMTGQTYLPDYVRLRMIGCRSLSAPLASTHTGSTAVASGGCDAAVVPTLVDWQTDQVIVDSKRICLYLDAEATGPLKLRPEALAVVIDAELAIVDELPNYQMLMGKPPSGRDTPVTKKGGGGPGFSLAKVQRCERYLQEFPDDPVLVQAYTAKRDKELSAADQLFSPEAMQAAYAAADSACAQLDGKLKRNGSAWLFGETVTLADLFWGLELLRMKNLGADVFWDGGRLPHVARYVSASEALPAIRTAVLDYPGALF